MTIITPFWTPNNCECSIEELNDNWKLPTITICISGVNGGSAFKMHFTSITNAIKEAWKDWTNCLDFKRDGDPTQTEIRILNHQVGSAYFDFSEKTKLLEKVEVKYEECCK